MRTTRNLLLIVDPQVDFITGTMPVPKAIEAMNNLCTFIKHEVPDRVFNIMITLDCHPYNHCSFMVNGGLWPQHCIINTVGAAIYQPLMDSIISVDIQAEFEYKGSRHDIEEYSYLSRISKVTGRDEFVKGTLGRYDNIYVAGIAGDYCVLETLKDIEAVHNKVLVLKDCIASIDGGKALSDYCESNNIQTI